VSEIDSNIPPEGAPEASPAAPVTSDGTSEALPAPDIPPQGGREVVLEPAITPVALVMAPPPAPPASARINPILPVAVAVSAWAVPGLGHLLLGRWGRALTFLVAVAGLGFTGFALRGNVFHLQPGGFRSDPFNFLGSLADLGMGGLYFISQWFEKAGADVSRAAGDYGTRVIATAGIINFLAAFDAYEIASHKKD
jgi:hypothetical protein